MEQRQPATPDIGFVGPYPPIQGGIAQHSRQIVAAFVARGHTVAVESWAAQYPRLLYRGEQVATPAATQTDSGVNWSLRWWAPWTWVSAGRRLQRVGLVVVPWVHPFHVLALWVIIAVAGRPVVAVVHNLVPHERFLGDLWLARLLLRRTRGVVTHAPAVEEQVAAALPDVPRQRTAHPPNLALAPVPLPTGAPDRVLFLGYVRPYKGVDLLLEALTKPELEAVHATIAGEMWDPDPDELAALVHDHGLDARVTLIPGYASDELVRELLSDHHLLVAPYRSATQSGLVPLAQAAGRGVVATAVGGLNDQVRHRIDGILVPAGEVEALAQGIRTGLDDCERLGALAAEAAPRWSDVVIAIEDLAGIRPAKGE